MTLFNKGDTVIYMENNNRHLTEIVNNRHLTEIVEVETFADAAPSYHIQVGAETLAVGGAQLLSLEEAEAEVQEALEYPDNNPKAAIGAKKIPVDTVPPVAILGIANAMADGAAKYGAYNFRTSKIAANVYMGAAMRHLLAWWDGEDCAQDSGVHHLDHVMACLAIARDAMHCGTFDDNRPPKSGAAAMIADFGKEDTNVACDIDVQSEHR